MPKLNRKLSCNLVALILFTVFPVFTITAEKVKKEELNLFPNPSLEERNADGWPKKWGKPSNPPKINTVKENARTGNNSIDFVWDEYVEPKVYVDYFYSPTVSLKEDTDYLFSLYWKHNPKSLKLAYIVAHCVFTKYDSNGNNIGNVEAVYTKKASKSNDWQRIEFSIPSIDDYPQNGNVKLRIRIGTGAWQFRHTYPDKTKGQTWGWMDDFSLIRLSSQEAVTRLSRGKVDEKIKNSDFKFPKNFTDWGYWDSPFYGANTFNHSTIIKPGVSPKELQLALDSGRRIIIYNPLIPRFKMKDDDYISANEVGDLKRVIDKFGSELHNRIIFWQLSQDTHHGNNPVPYTWWEGAMKAVKKYLGEDTKIGMDFMDGYGGPLPGGLDYYSYEFYAGSGWEKKWADFIPHTSNVFAGFRKRVRAANGGKPRPIYIAARGWISDPKRNDLTPEFIKMMARFAQREREVAGVHFWGYTHIGEHFRGIQQMPKTRAMLDRIGDKIIANSKIETLKNNKIKTTQNIIYNSNFEKAWETPTKNLAYNGNFEEEGCIDNRFPQNFDSLLPRVKYYKAETADDQYTRSGTRSIKMRWHRKKEDGESTNAPFTMISVSPGQRLKVSAFFKRDKEDTSSKSRARIHIRAFGLPNISLTLNIFQKEFTSYEWEEISGIVEIPWYITRLNISLETAQFEIASQDNCQNQIGYWDDLSVTELNTDDAIAEIKTGTTHPLGWNFSRHAPLYIENGTGEGNAYSGQRAILLAKGSNKIVNTSSLHHIGGIFLDKIVMKKNTRSFPYTLSGYAKVSQKDKDGSAKIKVTLRTARRYVQVNKPLQIDEKIFTINRTEWQRFYFTVNLPKESYYTWLEIAPEANEGEDSVVLLDSIQLEPNNKPTDYTQMIIKQ